MQCLGLGLGLRAWFPAQLPTIGFGQKGKHRRKMPPKGVKLKSRGSLAEARWELFVARSSKAARKRIDTRGRLWPDKSAPKARPRGSGAAGWLAGLAFAASACLLACHMQQNRRTGNNRLLTNDSPSGLRSLGLPLVLSSLSGLYPLQSYAYASFCRVSCPFVFVRNSN